MEGVRGEGFGARHEVSGGVVDEGVDFTELRFGCSEGRFDGAIIAHITSGECRSAALAMNLFASFVQRSVAAADEKHSRAELGEMDGHGAAESAAATGQEDGAALEKIG